MMIRLNEHSHMSPSGGARVESEAAGSNFLGAFSVTVRVSTMCMYDRVERERVWKQVVVRRRR